MGNIIKGLVKLNEDRRRIFDIILKYGPVSKSNILGMTKMKLTTLNRIVQQLEDYSLIAESGTGESTGGRKPSLYDANLKSTYILGLEISRTSTRIIITNLKMEVLFKEQFPMENFCTPEKTCSLIAAIANSAFASLAIDKGSLLGAGVGTVGPMDRSSGIMINPVNFPAPGWQGVPIADMLSDSLNCPVIIDNGANTAVLSEFLFGEGKKFSSIAYFNCGVGIRTGAITAGTIIRSINDSEDSFGHMIIDVDGELCSCGNFGCIECYSSIAAIIRNFKAALKKGRSATISKNIDELDFLDICTAAEQGDALAREVLSGAAAIFGAGLANYINLFSPGLVVLSGPLIKNSKLFYDVSTEIAIKKFYKKEKGSIVFSRGGYFGDDAIAVGAAALMLEHFLGSSYAK